MRVMFKKKILFVDLLIFVNFDMFPIPSLRNCYEKKNE